MSEFFALNYTKYLEQTQMEAKMMVMNKITNNINLKSLLLNPESPDCKISKSLLLPSKASFQETIFNLGNALSLLKSNP